MSTGLVLFRRFDERYARVMAVYAGVKGTGIESMRCHWMSVVIGSAIIIVTEKRCLILTTACRNDCDACQCACGPSLRRK